MEAQSQQLVKIPDYLSKWRSQYLEKSTINSSLIEDAIQTIYQAMRLATPKIEYCDSPLAASTKFSLDYWGNELIKIDELIEQNLKQELGIILWQQLHQQIYEPLHQQLWEGVGIKIFDCLQDNYLLWHELNSPLEGNSNYFNPVMDFVTTEYLITRACWFDFAYEALHCQSAKELWQSYQSLVTNCGWLLTYKNICLVCSRPLEITVDEQMRLHSEEKPAILFADGLSIYANQELILPEKTHLNSAPIVGN